MSGERGFDRWMRSWRLLLAACAARASVCDGWSDGEILIVGAGFSRSGTTALDMALSHFGYTVYHGTTFHKRSHDWLHWASAVTDPRKQPLLWNRLLAAGFNAFLDSPASDLWASQLAHSPAAKVIFSRRDPAIWAESLLEVRRNPYVPHHGWWRRRPFKWLPPFSSLRTVMEFIHLNDCGRRRCGNATDAKQLAAVRRSFEVRLKRVQEEVPPSQLLLWDPAEGWAPLCSFLNATRCPEGPLPVLNQRTEWLQQAEVQGRNTVPKLDILEYLWLPFLILVALCVRACICRGLHGCAGRCRRRAAKDD